MLRIIKSRAPIFKFKKTCYKYTAKLCQIVTGRKLEDQDFSNSTVLKDEKVKVPSLLS
jgi:hypothetical protein